MKYSICREYLVPVFQYVTVEANSVEEACEHAIALDDWDDAKEDYECSGQTYIAAVAELPEGEDPDYVCTYELPQIVVPERFTANSILRGDLE